MNFSEDQLPAVLQGEGLCVRSMPHGGMRLNLLEIPAGTDFTPALKGLPDDLCPSAHWGIVLSGELHCRQKDGSEETVSAGKMFYWPPGHTVWCDVDVKFFEVSPQGDMETLLRHVGADV